MKKIIIFIVTLCVFVTSCSDTGIIERPYEVNVKNSTQLELVDIYILGGGWGIDKIGNLSSGQSSNYLRMIDLIPKDPDDVIYDAGDLNTITFLFNDEEIRFYMSDLEKKGENFDRFTININYSIGLGFQGQIIGD